MKKTESEKPKKIPHGVIIAVIPGIGFLLSYLYELGCIAVFGIPYYFITIELKTSFLPILFLSLFIFLIYLYLFEYLKKMQLEKIRNALFKSSMATSLIILLLDSVYLLSSPRKTFWGWYNVIFFFLLALILYFLCKKKKKRGLNITEKKRNIIKLVTLQVVLIGFFAYSIGMFFASTKSRYLTFIGRDAKIELVVLRKYGNTLICGHLDRKNKKVYKSFYFIDFTNCPNTKFKLEKVGPLKSIDEPFYKK